MYGSAIASVSTLNSSNDREPARWIERRAATGSLIPHVDSFFLYRNDRPDVAGHERIDLGQLRFMISGGGQVRFPDGHIENTHKIMVNGPGTAAAHYHLKGPVYCFGVSLRAMGWKALIGLPANKVADHIVNGEKLFCEKASELYARLLHMQTIDEMVAAISPLLKMRQHEVKPIPKAHLIFLRAVRAWAAGGDPTLDALYSAIRAKSNIGERQVQRLCLEYFAGSPAHLRRKFRAIGAAMRIYQGANIDEVMAPFSDQSHMINEIRHFTGFTPTSLRGPIDPIMAATLSDETFHFLPDVFPEAVDVTAR